MPLGKDGFKASTCESEHNFARFLVASALVGADFFCAISIGALLANRTAVFTHVWWLVTRALVYASCFGAISIGALSAGFADAFTAVVTLALI